MAGNCECVNEPSGSIKELTASSFTFSLVSFLVIDSFLSWYIVGLLHIKRKLNTLLRLYNTVHVKVTSSHKPADKFLLCVGNSVCRFDVKALVLLSVHLI